MTESERLIHALGLLPHPEGGHYRETFRDSAGLAGRAHCTAIYFLLKADEVSHWHRIDAAEIWHYYRGAPLQIEIADKGEVQRIILGPRIEEGEQPQVVVPPGAWQSARTLGEYTLVGCSVAPGFEFSTFELAAKDFSPQSMDV